MTAPGMATTDWEPQFLDYLYLAFTNSTAFSPTTRCRCRGGEVRDAAAVADLACVDGGR
jgi:hypothetical protein